MNKAEIEHFSIQEKKDVFKCRIFNVQENLVLANTQNIVHKMYTISCVDWVNIVPVTNTGEIVLIEQYRVGCDELVYEVPGGAVDPDEKDTTLSALRELEEETGLTSQCVLSLAGFNPNPALNNNRMHYFIAFDVQPLEKKLDFHDPFESIRVHLVSIEEAMQMVRTGKIQHALSALALLLAEPYIMAKYRK